MTSSSHRISLSLHAQRDLQEIFQYSLEQWGPTRRNAYAKLFAEGLAQLRAFPMLGRARTESKQNLRSLPVGEHVVFYTVSESNLTIVRIAHQRQVLDLEDSVYCL